MSGLQRKLFRDLRVSKGQYAALTLLVALGIAVFGAMYTGYQNLDASENRTYEELKLADITVKITQAQTDVVSEVESLPGVEASSGRIVRDVSLLKPGSETELVTGRVISVPEGHHPRVNDVLMDQGSYFSMPAEKGVLVDRQFAEHHGLERGDVLYIVMAGERIPLEVKGVVTTPEYIWPAKSKQELMVAPGSFGVLFMPRGQVEEMFGMQGIINEVNVIVEEGADQLAVKNEMERILAPFGVMDVIPREEQPSYALLKMDLEGFREIAVFVPVLFFIVTALVTYVLLTRTVHAQRAQIGLMRATGYSQAQVLRHYLSFALLIAAAGSVVGTVVGYFLGALLTRMYADVLHIPFVQINPSWGIILGGIILGFVFCGIAGILPAWNAARTAPAEVMRTPPPVTGKTPLIERMLPFLSRLPYSWKIPLRNLFRSQRRTLYTAIGTAVAVALTLASFAMLDAMDYAMGLQFGKIRAYDLKAMFAQPQLATVLSELQEWQGVENVEPILEIPARLKHEDKTYATVITGLLPQSVLYKLRSASEEAPLNAEGLYLGKGLAKILDVKVGDSLELQTEAGSNVGEVAGIVEEPMGSTAYTSLEQLQEMTGLTNAISGAMLKVESASVGQVQERLNAFPGIAAVEELAQTRKSLSDIMAMFYEFVGIFIVFGLALAFAVIFNTVMVNVLERAREMATMRTLGVSSGRIGLMITVENLLMGIIGVVLGVALGIALEYELLMMFESDLFSLELAIYPKTYALSIIGVLVVLLLSQIPGIRHVNRLDLARVTKEQAA